MAKCYKLAKLGEGYLSICHKINTFQNKMLGEEKKHNSVQACSMDNPVAYRKVPPILYSPSVTIKIV